MVELILSGIQSVIFGMVIFFIQRGSHRRDARDDSRAKARMREAALLMRLTDAGNRLSYAVAMAVRRGRPNGEIEEAVTAYEAASAEYNEFCRCQAQEHLNESCR